MAHNEFDFDEFKKAKFEERKLFLDLDNFGDTKETVRWHYRGLTAHDMAAIEEAALNSDKIESVVNAALTAIEGDAAELVKALGGDKKKIPASLLRRYEILERGSLEPNKPSSRIDTVNFAKAYPVEFKLITDKIWTATSMGMVSKKKHTHFIKKAKSETESPLPVD